MSRPDSNSPDRAIRVAIADDCVLIRHALADALGEAPELALVAVCADADELRAAVSLHRPDIVIADIRMPPTMTDDGARLATELRATHPELAVILLSAYCEPDYAVALLRNGTAGRAYLLKDRLADIPQLIATIVAVAGGASIIDAKVAQMLRPDAAPDA